MTLKINQAVSATIAAPIAEAAAWPKAADKAPIDLAQAVPSYDPAPELLDFLSKAVKDASSAFYTPILGLPRLREALAADLSGEYGANIQARAVTITTGCNHAFCMATSALAGPGDEIILPEPFYFNHDMWFTMQGIRKITLPCHAREEGMVPDPEEAKALITPRTRAIVLISPNNPTGTIYSTERLRAFYRLAERHGISLILDETYKDFRPFGESQDEAPHPLFQEENWPDVLIQLYSFSKAYSLTGYRVGSLIAGPKVIEAVTKIADTITICPPHIGQLAALYGLENLKPWREEKRGNMLRLIAELEAAFEEHNPPFEIIAKGAFFAYLQHPFASRSSLEVAKSIAAEQGLLLLPGEYFGSGQKNYLRAAFANASADQLFESARRLKATVAD